MSLPIDSQWGDSDNRVLFVLETVDSEDLRENSLLFNRSRTVLSNLLKLALKQARAAGAEGKFAFAAINFNNHKFFDQPKEKWGSYRKIFSKRIFDAIEQLKPTSVVVFGDDAMHTLFPEIDYVHMKKGWVHKKSIGDHKFKVTGTLDLERLYTVKKTEAQKISAAEGDEEGDEDEEDEGGNKDVYGPANLLFYVSRNLTNALCGRLLYSLRDIKPHPVYVDTLEKFKKLWFKLVSAEVVAFDCETRNLSSLHNAIHTIQFAFSQDKGYVLPVDHPQTPFSQRELRIIKGKLKQFFGAEPKKLPLKYLITQYGMFDLRIIRSCLNIPLIFHPVWEITAGEYCFHPDTLVETERGKLRIRDIVANSEDIRVWSKNMQTGTLELKPLINKILRPSDEPMVRVTYVGGSIRVTESHPIWSNTRQEYVQAIDINLNEEVRVFDANNLECIAKVKSVRYIESSKEICDLTVADNHNLFVCHATTDSSILVKNCLDENLKYLKNFKTPHGGLSQIFCYYGNDHYLTADFKKTDRSNTALTKLDNPNFIAYAACDVQSIWGIHLMQQERAKTLTVGDKPFLPYFRRLVLKQMSNTVHVISHMKQVGSHIDKYYLATLKSVDSPLLKLMDKIKAKIFDTPEVRKANKRLIRESNTQTTNKGLFNKTPFVFSLTKPSHKILLFFTVMGLKPVSFTRKEKTPQVNKLFIAHYKEEEPIVEQYGKWSKLQKLFSTYISGWWNKLMENEDSRTDSYLRPDYDFFPVVTGRLNSSGPSLHQVPTQGEEAGKVKRAFVAYIGGLLIKFDMSAHEVRVWSYVSFDTVLASIFKIGQRLRQMYRLSPTSTLLARIKKEGDIHILNVRRFWGKWVTKDDPLRYSVKAVIFGCLFGKGPTALARDVKNTVDFAKGLIEKLFKEFPAGAAWLNWTVQHVLDYGYTYSPIGMRRNLFAILTGIDSIISAMGRRAKNSPIQGFASQIGVTIARLISLELYKTLKHFNRLDRDATRLPAEVEKMVHDAVYSGVPYEIILIYLHIIQYMATYGVTKYYKEEFDFQFTVEPEIEIEIGASEDSLHSWDWSHANLLEILKQSLTEQEELKMLPKGVTKQDAYKKIMADYKDSEVKAYLDLHYPILSVQEGQELKELKAA
jgi:DNA polymerase I-like protein with 3'-5' exonuclease and polymerase domains